MPPPPNTGSSARRERVKTRRQSPLTICRSREHVEEKGIALDMHVRPADGRRLDVEMQADKRQAFRNRALYYWARLFASQLKRGQPYKHDQVAFTDHLAIHVIELPKRAIVSRNDRQNEPDLLSWMRFLGAKTDEEAKEACMSNPKIAEANELLEHLSATESARYLALWRELALDGYRIEMAGAREEGIAEGRVEGRVEGRSPLDPSHLHRPTLKELLEDT